MKGTHSVLFLGLIVLLALLVPVPASAEGVVGFDVHQISPANVVSPARLWRMSDGRVGSSGEVLSICYRANAPRPEPDYVTGCWYFEINRILSPGGEQEVWGTSVWQDLVAYPRYDGGWDATFTGNLTASFPAQMRDITLTAEGWGDLAGWRIDAPCDPEPVWHLADFGRIIWIQ